jgi:wyosine [tRNA(Phe)-imidazoG37] synthetase (radical SAM superfamily)
LDRQDQYPVGDIIRELEQYFSRKDTAPDYITLAGSGEPTLNRGLGRLIQAIKQLTRVPVAVLTNGSLLFLPEVRKELLDADVVLPSLDAVSESIFQTINRPAPGLQLEKIIAGLAAFRQEFSGRIWLEILLLRGINDNIEELEKFRQTLKRLRPDRVQLNTAVRPVVEDYAAPLTLAQLQAAATLLGEGVEVIADFGNSPHQTIALSDADFLETLARRPLTAEDLAEVLGLPLVVVLKKLEHLQDQGLISYNIYQHRGFYQCDRPRSPSN